MAVRSRYFEPNTYYYKVLTLCFVLLVDIIFNSFTQFLTFGQKITDSTCHSDDLYLCIGLAVFQFIIIMICWSIGKPLFTWIFWLCAEQARLLEEEKRAHFWNKGLGQVSLRRNILCKSFTWLSMSDRITNCKRLSRC